MSKFYPYFLLSVILSFLALSAHAAYITRTIVIDGSMADWYDTPPTYTPAGNITINTTPNQFSTDGQNGGDPNDDLDEPIGSTGRDLKKFSFTWDNTYIYFYVERWASSTNVTDWWFYIDNDADDIMESGEKVVRVNWQGANRRTNVDIYDYVWSGDPAAGGDALTNAGIGDGWTMQGGITNGVSQYTNTVAGATSGTEMESRVSWASLGFPGGPSNVKFHISSSNGTNLPDNILDNMDGPGGGSLFPQDLAVTKTASVASASGKEPFSYTIEVFNSAIIAFTNVEISDVIPSVTNYVSHSAEVGTTFDDSDANSIPDEWNIPSIPANTTYTLTINVTGGNVPSTTTSTNTATLTASDQTDVDATNDIASVDVDIEPSPDLTMVKDSSVTSAKPGEDITYTITITNEGAASTTPVIVTDALSSYTMLSLTPFVFSEGSTPSNLSMGVIKYSDDDGATYAYSPLVSGGGGAPAGYDANVTNWRVEMIGTMAPSDSSFEIDYQVQTR